MLFMCTSSSRFLPQCSLLACHSSELIRTPGSSMSSSSSTPGTAAVSLLLLLLLLLIAVIKVTAVSSLKKNVCTRSR